MYVFLFAQITHQCVHVLKENFLVHIFINKYFLIIFFILVIRQKLKAFECLLSLNLTQCLRPPRKHHHHLRLLGQQVVGSSTHITNRVTDITHCNSLPATLAAVLASAVVPVDPK